MTRIKIATIALEPAGLAFYAQDRGYFRQQGIDAEFVIANDPTVLRTAFLSRAVQFSGSNVGHTAIMKANALPIRVVAAGALYKPGTPNTGLVVAPGKRITRARDLVGKRVGIDAADTIAHVAVLKWLKRNGVRASDVRWQELGFPLMLGPLRQGRLDAAILPEPYFTMALRVGAKPIGRPVAAVCSQECLLTVWLAHRDIEPTLAARFRNAIQAAAVWANRPQNDAASAAILARYAPIDKKVTAAMTRTRFAERLRPAQAQPWIDAYAEFGVIPASFRAIDLVR